MTRFDGTVHRLKLTDLRGESQLLGGGVPLKSYFFPRLGTFSSWRQIFFES